MKTSPIAISSVLEPRAASHIGLGNGVETQGFALSGNIFHCSWAVSGCRQESCQLLDLGKGVKKYVNVSLFLIFVSFAHITYMARSITRNACLIDN